MNFNEVREKRQLHPTDHCSCGTL